MAFGFLFVGHGVKHNVLVCRNSVKDSGGILLLFEPSTAEQNSGYEASDPNHHANDDPPDGFGRDLGFSMNGAG